MNIRGIPSEFMRHVNIDPFSDLDLRSAIGAEPKFSAVVDGDICPARRAFQGSDGHSGVLLNLLTYSCCFIIPLPMSNYRRKSKRTQRIVPRLSLCAPNQKSTAAILASDAKRERIYIGISQAHLVNLSGVLRSGGRPADLHLRRVRSCSIFLPRHLQFFQRSF